jgi:pimeloyl-ACP methyl ester carboxylesterase
MATDALACWLRVVAPLGRVVVSNFVPWDSQPLEAWAARHAPGKFVDLGGRRTHYLVTGKGPPVVLVHGFNLDLNTWTANVRVLAQRFTVYALDLWGSGFSTREPLDYGFPLFVEQLRAFVDQLEIERFHLVGHSMGGGTAIVFGVQHRSRVDRLVLVDPVGVPRGLPLRGRLFMLPLIPEMLLGMNTDVIRRKNLRDYWIHDPELLTDEIFDTLSGHQKIEGSTRAALDVLRRNFFNTLEREIHALAELDIPTLLVWGRHDRSVPLESGMTMHRILVGSRLEVFDDAGHLPNFDQADRFNEMVLDFFGGQA